MLMFMITDSSLEYDLMMKAIINLLFKKDKISRCFFNLFSVSFRKSDQILMTNNNEKTYLQMSIVNDPRT
jgi:hypothetical protein